MKHHAEAAAIEADAVSFAYPGGIRALEDLSFYAGPGEMVAVMGANGSGKTTLMKVLMRLLHPQQGHVRLGTAEVAGLASAELYRRIGMVFQNPVDQLFAASVRQDVAFGPRNMALAESEITARVDEALEAAGALDLAERSIQQLSFGQQKRVCLAGVLAMQPSILVFDEPTAGLDPAGESQMIELLVRLNRQRKITTILATHCVDLLPVLADRIYVLAHGRVRQEGTPQAIFADGRAVAEAGLRLPLVAQLFRELGSHGMACDAVPLTIDDARRQILLWLARGTRCDQPTGGGP
jgi:cobalt/nickel transport system ATP-binding protein